MKKNVLRLVIKSGVVLIVVLVTACTTLTTSRENNSTDYTNLKLADKPNILWLVTEDMGPYIPAFGDSTIQTPNLSRLADEGIIYPNLYSVSGVCAPSRAAIATGMYPSGIGASNHRTGSNTEQTGLRPYEAVPPPYVKMLSEMLREQGYYCTNNYKTDYQFKEPCTAWDECSPYAHWRNRADGQPFYAVFNFMETHESGLFDPYGFRQIETRHYHEGDRTYIWETERMTEEETPIHVAKDTEFPIPPYLPETDTVRRDMWKEYNNIAEMDKQVGAVLKQLEEDRLLENTIIFFYGDHGGPYPRQKRLVYDSGLHTPMIIRFPNKQMAGHKDSQLISFVDFAPTILSLVGVNPPEYIQGQAFMGKYSATHQRKYIHAAADRFDEVTDVLRAVRDKQFKYIRNYRPWQGYYLPNAYREQIPTMQQLLNMRDAGTLNSIQKQWFRESKPREELFDCEADPHELHNLATDPAYSDKLKELSAEMDRWIAQIGDQPNLPEAELIKQLWNGAETQPVTDDPFIVEKGGKVTVSCATEGASIGYKIMDGSGTSPDVWTIYNEPFELPQNSKLLVKAHRIGFLPSKIVHQTVSN